MARVLPQLPTEIIQSELLPRLPAKSIGRFRCVCNTWNSFLCSPDFARAHLRYNTKYKLLLLDQPTQTFCTLDCEPVNHDSITNLPIPFKGDVVIVASLDGLVCVVFRETNDLAFWNPLTGAYKKIYTKFVVDMSGVFTFYIDSSNDYKLLHIVSKSGEGFIYSRRLDSWRKIPHLENIIRSFNWGQAIFLGEKIYFKLETWRSGGPQRGLISFDVESEKFKEIQFPPLTCGASLYVNLVALNGCIHLCVGYKDIHHEGFKCDMWRIDGDKWIKVATFDRSCYQPLRHIHIRRNGNWLAIWENDNSFNNIDLKDYIYYFLPGYSDHEQKGVICMGTFMSPGEGQRRT
ncbi:F-box/kelch-repeat protein At3g06240-like [Bidens hawaiensis]|uniref:F-box/kelch-repeat protein At3g06240-like n=1 Tax=Bidens hawaiensis TaxID=980011 RepID=UPI0040495165